MSIHTTFPFPGQIPQWDIKTDLQTDIKPKTGTVRRNVNNEARFPNYYCRGKATTITHSESMSVALRNQRAKRMRPIRDLPQATISVHNISHTAKFLTEKKNVTDHEMCFDKAYCNIRPKDSFIPRRIHGDAFINAVKSLARPGRKQARRNACDFNNIEPRAVIKFSFSPPARQGGEGNSRHSDRNISLFLSWSG